MQDDFKKIDVKRVLQEKAPAMARRIPGFVTDYLAHAIHQNELNEILRLYADKEGVDFMEELIGYFDLKLRVRGEENMPDGRFIFVGNHPLGGLDGICLAAIIGKRYDGHIRYLVNDMLLHLSNLRSIFVPINKHGRQARENALLMAEAYASDNQIINFPAGLCSRRINGTIQDPEWKKSFIQKAIEYKRDIVPVFFDGKNSKFFYNLASFRKTLGIKVNCEMFYLPDEMFKARGKEFTITFGSPIPWQTFDNSRNAEEWANEMRRKVYEMKK